MKLLFRKRRSATPRPDAEPINDAIIVELAIKDFYWRRDQGSELSPTEYAKQYPGIESRLLADLEFEESLIELDSTGLLYESSSSGDLSIWHERLQQGDDETPWPKVDDKVGEFTLVEQIGRGRFSRVFAARSSSTAPEIAIKICRRQGTHEARALSEMTHSAIGVVQGVKTVPATDLIAICMPLKSRATLADVLQCVTRSDAVPEFADFVWDEVQSRNKLHAAPPAWAGKCYAAWAHSVMSTLAEALSAAHGQSTAHCDIKPPNVLITAAEGSPILIDFNLSLRWDVESSSPNIGGTLPYMAPEHIQAFDTKQRGSIGPRTDIFGLAATVYQLLTGELPFETPSDGSVREILKLRKTRPRSICVKNPHVSPHFDALILKCLSYHPKDRPQTAAELVARLNELSPAASATDAPPRRRVAVRAAMVTVALAFAAVAFMRDRSSQLLELSIAASQPNMATVDRAMTPEQAEAEVKGLLNDGYDAYENGDFETAATMFQGALKLDPKHEGAAFGCTRAHFKLGNVAAAGLMVSRIPVHDIKELHALRGLCLAANGNYSSAASECKSAIDGGCETPAVLTNYAYCLQKTNRYTEAVAVLERVREMGGDTSTANLILAGTYVKLWLRRGKGKIGPEVDTDLLVSLLDECPESPVRSRTAGILYTHLAALLGRNDAAAKAHWTQRSLIEFTRGRELGLNPKFTEWNLSTESLAQLRLFYLRDPRFERCVERTLSPRT